MGAGEKAIKAGEAYLELVVKDDKFAGGLEKSFARMRSSAKSLAIIGAGITAVGGLITVPFVEAIKTFGEVGESMTQMSGRTGVGVEALSILGYAAKQSGTDVETLELNLSFLSKSIYKAVTDTKSGAKAFNLLGISLADLRTQSPEQQLLTVVKRISEIEEPALRSGAAMALLGGRGGTAGKALLPMIENFSRLSHEAEHFNLVISKDAAERGEKLNSAFGLLSATFEKLKFAIGDAFSEQLTAGIRSIAECVGSSIKWVETNKELVVTIGTIGAAVTIFGAGITTFGVGLALVGTALSAILATMGLLLTPTALVIGALGLGVAAFLKFTKTGNAVLQFLGDKFDKFKTVAGETFSGISDALAGGDIVAAANVLFAGLKVVWVAGTNALSNAWSDMLSSISVAFYETMAGVKVWWVESYTFLAKHAVQFGQDFNAGMAEIQREIVSKVLDAQIALYDARIKSLTDRGEALHKERDQQSAILADPTKSRESATAAQQLAAGNPMLTRGGVAVARIKAIDEELKGYNDAVGRETKARNETAANQSQWNLDSGAKIKAINDARDEQLRAIEDERKVELGKIKIGPDAAEKQRQADELAKAQSAQVNANAEFAKARAAAAAARKKGFGGALAGDFGGVAGAGTAAGFGGLSSAQGISRSTFSGRLAEQIFGAAGGDNTQKQILSESKKHTTILNKIQQQYGQRHNHTVHNGMKIGGR